jgi:ubiquinone/menaquinone biosynthesis C-methylase UbiE
MRVGARFAVIALAAAASSEAQDVPYVATPPEVVERMLQLAQVKAGDVVYDLGCGDGRTVVAAVERKDVRGVCVEIDPQRLRWARDNAQAAGVADRIRLVEGNFFDVPIADATVVLLYLSRPVNLQLRPRLLKELKPGTRVVSYTADMGDWEPDQTLAVEQPFPSRLYLWTIPPRPGR